MGPRNDIKLTYAQFCGEGLMSNVDRKSVFNFESVTYICHVISCKFKVCQKFLHSVARATMKTEKDFQSI